MRIVFILNNNYERITDNAIQSVLKHNKADISCLINKNVSQEFRSKYNCTVYDEEVLQEFNIDKGYKHISLDAYAKLLIPKYFKEKILYLDGDIICLGALDELWNTNFDNNYIVGCKGIDYSAIQAQELDIPFYINSGVMLMNCKQMNKDNYFEYIKNNWKKLINKPKEWSHDETIINGLFNNKIKLINEKYNYCYQRDYKGREVKNPTILHFTGQNKNRIFEYATTL